MLYLMRKKAETIEFWGKKIIKLFQHLTKKKMSTICIRVFYHLNKNSIKGVTLLNKYILFFNITF